MRLHARLLLVATTGLLACLAAAGAGAGGGPKQQLTPRARTSRPAAADPLPPPPPPDDLSWTLVYRNDERQSPDRVVRGEGPTAWAGPPAIRLLAADPAIRRRVVLWSGPPSCSCQVFKGKAGEGAKKLEYVGTLPDDGFGVVGTGTGTGAGTGTGMGPRRETSALVVHFTGRLLMGYNRRAVYYKVDCDGAR